MNLHVAVELELCSLFTNNCNRKGNLDFCYFPDCRSACWDSESYKKE